MAKLSPVFNDQTFDANGNPASGYKVFTYIVSSSTKLATYTDSAGLTPQTNPIILNSSGFPTNGPIWLAEGQRYKFVLASASDTDPPTSPIRTINDVAGVNDSSSSNTQWVSSGVTPTYVSASSFTLSGDQTTEFHVGRRLQFTVTAGTVYGTILTSVFGASTTVTMTMDTGMALDSGLSTVNLSILRADKSALPPPLIAGRLLAVQTFTGSGTYTPTTGSTSVVVEVLGGGGGGGGSLATGAGQIAAGSGGGSGAYGRKRSASPGVQAVTIGAVGTGGLAGAAGSNGGTSSFGAIVSATGGSGGSAGVAGATGNSVGPSGGTSTGGDINIPGNRGEGGWGIGSIPIVRGGHGANSFYGSGGDSVVTFATGNAAVGFGAGGGGGACTPSSGGAASGGSGTAGIVIVWEYA